MNIRPTYKKKIAPRKPPPNCLKDILNNDNRFGGVFTSEVKLEKFSELY